MCNKETSQDKEKEDRRKNVVECGMQERKEKSEKSLYEMETGKREKRRIHITKKKCQRII